MKAVSTISANNTSKRIGFLLLLSLIVPTVNWIFLLSTFIAPGRNIALEIHDNELLFRLAIFIEIVTSVIVLALAYYLHRLLKSVNENVSFLAFTFRTVEVMLTMVLALGQFIGLMVLNVAVGENSIFIDVLVGKYIILSSFLGIFMGLGMLLYSYLFLKSGYISKRLATFGIMAYLLVTVYDSAMILFPDFASKFPVQLLGGLPVCLFILMISFKLLTKGFNLAKKQ